MLIVPDVAANTNDARRHDGLKPMLLCFSHLRWNFVLQRPQHLMSRFAGAGRVIYWEEAIIGETGAPPVLDLKTCPRTGVEVATPHLPRALNYDQQRVALRALLDGLVGRNAAPIIRWYYTPMMLPISRHIPARCVVYDCMDELANFKSPPQGLEELEAELLAAADVVFTGGQSLYEAKRDRHANVHAFPSSVDTAHFAQARAMSARSARDATPVFGFFGVIDERMDLSLIAALADARPDCRIEMAGPFAKIDESRLPQQSNISWLGNQQYDDLPALLGSWDVALMPFAINAATAMISPTKTPEYLAGGRPVVSTPINDVVRSYGHLQGVHIAATAAEFVAACNAALAQMHGDDGWLAEADALLAQTSWDKTFASMKALVDGVVGRPLPAAAKREHYDYLVVGAGFAGSVMAERLAADGGKRVLVLDRRPHIAGNAFDTLDEGGILYHQYGPHIFHTNSDMVVDYLSRFTELRPYEHRVLGVVDDKLVPIPINRATINTLYDLDLKTDDEAQTWLDGRAEPVETIRTSEDVVVSKVGRELYEKFFQGYTRKQWGLDPSELDKSVTARVPTRNNVDDRYFTDSFQAMPKDGYTAMFTRMLDNPNIDVMLGVDYANVRMQVDYDRLVFTGPIDEYFGFRFGALPYRSLRFQHETHDVEQFLPVGTVNHPTFETPFTRVSEYKHLTGQVAPNTTITYEFPSAEGDPYYPIPREDNQRLFKRYEALALAEDDVIFVGRLATYRYYNMDQVVGQALATYRRLSESTTIETRELVRASDA